MTNSKRLTALLALSAATLFSPYHLSAQTVWDGGGNATTDINLNTNWNNNIANSLNGTQTGTFGTGGSSATMNVDGYFSTLVFNRNDAAGFTIGGAGILSVLASGTGGTQNFSVSDTAGNGTTTINSNLRLNTDAGGTRLLVIDNRESGTTGESLSITNGISASNANAYGLRFSGSGSTRIAGAIIGTLTSNIQQASVAGQNMAGTVTIAGNQSLGSSTQVSIAGNGGSVNGNVASTAKFVMGDSTADIQSWGSTTVNQAATVEVKSTATLTSGISLSNAASNGSSGGTLDVSGNLSATTLAIGGAAYSGTLRVSGNASFSGAITSGVTAGSKIVGGSGTNGVLSLSSGTVGSAVTIGGGLSNENNLALMKTTTGTLTINSANTYSGGTTIESGGGSGSFAIALGANNALGSGPLTVGNANTGSNGARLRMNGFNQSVSALSSGGPNAQVIENLGASNSVLTANQGSNSTYGGVLRDRSTGATGATGNLGLTKSGAGILTLSSSSSTYTGATTLSEGVLEVASLGSTGLSRTISTTAGSNIVGVDDTTGLTAGMTFAAATLPAGFSITSVDSPTQISINTSSNIATGAAVAAVFGVNSSIGMATSAESNLVFDGGTLRYTGGNASTNRNFSITGTNTAKVDVSNSATALTLTGAASSGTGSLEKLGGGTLILAATNGFSGSTTVTAGTLLLSSTGSLAGGVEVANNAIIGGSGTIAGSLNLISGANFRFSLTDTLVVNGSSITFGGFSVNNLVGLDSSVDLASYTLIGGSSTINTTNLSNLGSMNAYDLGDGKFAYFETGAGSMNLVVIPEPSSIVFLILGAGVAVLLRRTRRDRSQIAL